MASYDGRLATLVAAVAMAPAFPKEARTNGTNGARNFAAAEGKKWSFFSSSEAAGEGGRERARPKFKSE